MIDHPLKGERHLSMREAADLVPGNRGNALRAVYRWAREGVKAPTGRVRLETLRVGGYLFTSKEALERFITVLNVVHPDRFEVIRPDRPETPPKPPRQTKAKPGRYDRAADGVL